MTDYAWLQQDIAKETAEAFSIATSKEDEDDIFAELNQLRPWANKLLENFCQKAGIGLRQLSRRDALLLATAAVFESVIASDEWPLKFVVDELIGGGDDYQIEIVTSIHVLHMLETNGHISSDERRSTVRSWLLWDEKLPRGWRDTYLELFKEQAPRLQ
ncbi:hypothetical protein [Paraburkholderia sp. HD33-4]|uniref:hypothetical protein n=1 Tax=Paraburkholderia sp. HD33-4 TaxID=2883242 RepID=UPI001F2FA1AA|nr:hypothetical protein [Paraburkholderia sp. HD33-4]